MAFISFKPSDFFSTKLFSGTGAAQSITGVGFQPDFSLIKCRSGAEYWNLTDSPRGVTKNLSTNVNATESTEAQRITAFDSDGFSLGTNDQTNLSGGNFVSYNMKMGTTSGIAGTADITPSAYSFNQAKGMSIVVYTGNAGAIRTVLHGLGSAPDMIIIKQLTSSTNAWIVGGNNITSDWGGVLVLNTGASIFTNAYFGGAVPNATTFSISDTSEVNSSGTYVAYSFRSIKGFSKFGSYTGNTSSTNGPFINLGFRPAVMIIKNQNQAEAWQLFDNRRIGYNTANYRLYPNDAAVEAASTDYGNITANGFKITTGSGSTSQHDVNGGNQTYTYMAWAEDPIVGSGGTPGVAR